MRQLRAQADTFAIRGTFTIARGSRTEAQVLTVEVEDQEVNLLGRGECVPYAHYGESLEGTLEQVLDLRSQIGDGLNRQELQEALPAGAARNGVDAALWDLECKIARATGRDSPIPSKLRPVRTVRTLSLGTPQAMADEARNVSDHFGTLKLKLGGEPGNLDIDRVAAVRAAVPNHALVVDANESWSPESVEARIQALLPYELTLIEQPLPAGQDASLGAFAHATPLCADESFHTIQDLDRIAERYDVVNLKLDKTGGLTHALDVKQAALERGLTIMVGCMVGTSLAMAPALVLAQGVDIVDLDGPYLLAEDRKSPLGLATNGWISPSPDCWG